MGKVKYRHLELVNFTNESVSSSHNMSIKKKIERIIYKINPSKRKWKMKKIKDDPFYSISYVVNDKERILCFVENDSDMIMLYEYVIIQLVALKELKVICELKKKN